MVVPSLIPERFAAMEGKAALRAQLRAARRAHVASLPDAVRGLLFHRPPRDVAAIVPAGAVVGVYADTIEEAPASGYARWFFEAGHRIALPWFAERGAAMEFRCWDNPFDRETLELGPWGVLQPVGAPEPLIPEVAFVPLVGFTAKGDRLGMGAGHYDRWLERHPHTRAIGLAWDCQEVATLPAESHDRELDAVITPTPSVRAVRAMKPTWRKPVGILAMMVLLAAYVVAMVTLLEPVGDWPVAAQAVVYLVAGTIWIVPLGRFLRWMETGRFR